MDQQLKREILLTALCVLLAAPVLAGVGFVAVTGLVAL
jgi:hypothetical protein